MNVHPIAKFCGYLGGFFVFLVLKAQFASPYIAHSKTVGIALKGALLGGFLIYVISGVILRLVIFPIDDEDNGNADKRDS
jgi:hypothetical protein